MENKIEDLFKYAFDENFDPYPKRILDQKKYCILDIDDTLNSVNSPSLLSNIFSTLSSYNKKFRENLSEISNLIRKAQNGEKEYMEKAKEKILSCSLDKKLIEFACRKAAENFRFVKNFYPAIIDIKKLGYDLYLISGSFDPAVRFLAQRFPKNLEIEVKGSTLYFDNHMLADIDVMIGKNKVNYVEKILSSDKADFCVFVTDDIILDKELIELGMKYNFPTLLIGEKKEVSLTKEPLLIKAKFIRENAYELFRLARIFETIIITSLQPYEKIENVKEICRKIFKSDKKEEVIDFALKLYNLKRKNFNINEFYTNIIQAKYFDMEIEEIRKCIKRNFLEAHLI